MMKIKKEDNDDYVNQQIKVEVMPCNFLDNTQTLTEDDSDEKLHCNICFRVFLNKHDFLEDLKRHSKRKTKSSRPKDVKFYHCEPCDKDFISQNLYKEHVLAHSGEIEEPVNTCEPMYVKFYRCESCGKDFISKTLFHEHILVHSGVRLHICEKCNKSFIYRSDFMQHNKKFHPDSIKCEECGQTFTSWSAFKIHEPVHTKEKNFECEECGQKFSRKSNMTRHIIVCHTGAKDFKCKTCGKHFLTEKSLQEHAETHLVEGELTCDTCGKTFVTKAAITQHVLTH